MRLSIAARLNFFLLFIFSLVLIFSACYQAVRERDLIFTLIRDQSQEQMTAYFDGLNMLMLAGKMETRDELRDKFLSHRLIKDARIVRGEAVSRQYGPGRESEQPRDEYDRLALAGEASWVSEQSGLHNNLITTLPLRASRSAQGIDCLGCHQVAEGTVLGAVRIDHSLDPLFAQAERSILSATLSLTGIFVLGLLITLWVLRTWVLKPLGQLTLAMETAADRLDFGHRFSLDEQSESSEMGRVSEAYNQMLESVQAQLAQRPSSQVSGAQGPHQHQQQ